MGLIQNDLNDMLNDLVTKCFAINRTLDRGVNVLGIKFKMVQASDIIHHRIAHAYLGEEFADGIAAYQTSRNNLTIYGQTPIGDKDYIAPIDFIKDYYNENIELQDMISDAVDKAIEVGDHTTKVFLDGLLTTVAKYTAVAITLLDLFEDYGGDTFHLQVLDSVIEKYINV